MRTPRVTGRMLIVRRIVFWLLVVIVPLMAAEMALRIIGFARPRIPMGVQNATCRASAMALNRRFATDAFTADRYLLWRLEPGTNLGGIPVSADGTLGNVAPAKKKPEGTIRVLCLGDSVSALTYRVFPDIAARLANGAQTTTTLEVINASVAGYTTEQGRRLWGRLKHLHPDVVLISYGWNDHFPALNLPDKELGARNFFAAAAHRIFNWSRLYQMAAAPAGSRWHPPPDGTTSGTLRVGPDQFAENLEALVASVRAAGAQPILATQPSNLTAANTRHLHDEGFAADENTPTALHNLYNNQVRAAATATGAMLLDVDEAFEFRDRNRLFEADGMHLSGPGHNVAARLMVGVLRHLGYLTQEEFDRIVKTARYDTTASDKPLAAWTVADARLETTVGADTAVSVIAKNAGNTTWLRHHRVEEFGNRTNVDYGSVTVTGRWRTEGAATTGTAASSKLSHDLLPGESTSNTLILRAPDEPGEYLLEVGLEAAAIGPLSNLGADVTTVTVVAYPKKSSQ